MLIDCRVEGVSPLLVHAIPAHVLFPEGATTAVLDGDSKDGTPREQAAQHLYLGGEDDKTPVVPAANLFASIVEAGRGHKVGKRQLTTRDSSLVPGALAIVEPEVIIIAEKGWEPYSKMVTNQATKSKIASHRPRWDEWALEFTLDVDTSDFSPKIVRALVDDAGRKVGIGSHRPQCKGPFGRFRVTRWKEKKD